MSYLAAIAPALPQRLPARCGFVQLSSAYVAEASEARALGWPVTQIDGDHLWPLTHPLEVVSALLAMAATLADDPSAGHAT